MRTVRTALGYATAIAGVVVGMSVGSPARAESVQTSPPDRAQSTKGTASVSGRVIAADTGTPVRSATVTLALPVAGRWSATTDSEGRFRFTDLPAGRYSLRIAKAGFVSTTFGPNPRSAGPFELRDGQHLDRGDLRLPRGGVIAGRIIDEFGEPMVDVYVGALRSAYIEPGVRRLSPAASAQTNDLGEFRLHSLAPGKYYVSAALRLLQFAGATEGQQFVGASRGNAPTFYPGTATATDAQPVTVAAGETTATIDMRLLAVPLATLSGTVVDSRGQPAPRMVVMLNPARPDGALLPMQANLFESDAQGRFTLPNVVPGEYRLDVESMARMEAIGQSGSSGIRRKESDEFASQPIAVTGEDVRDIVVQTGRGFRVAGRIVIEGGSLAADALQRVSVNAYPIHPGQGASLVLQSAAAAVQADASFTVTGVTGRRLIRVDGLPAGHVLKGVRAYGADVTDGGIEVSQDIGGVEILITARPTQLAGTVTDAAGTATSEYTVIVFSDDSRRWVARMNRFVTALRPGRDGRFTVAGLPAGGYLAVALQTIDGGEWAEPENLEKLRAVATPFTLADGEARTLTLVIRAGR